MMRLAVLLLFVCLASADETPSHCRIPSRNGDSSTVRRIQAAYRECASKEIEPRCMLECLMDTVEVLDENSEVDAEEIVDLYISEEGYEDTKAFMADKFRECISNNYETDQCTRVQQTVECGNSAFAEECDEFNEVEDTTTQLFQE